MYELQQISPKIVEKYFKTMEKITSTKHPYMILPSVMRDTFSHLLPTQANYFIKPYIIKVLEPLKQQIALNPTYNNTKSDSITNTLSLKNKRESFNFKDFKDYVCNFNNINFSLSDKLGYSENHKGFCIKNGYIYSYHTEKFIEKEEAFKVWDYLFKNKQKEEEKWVS